MSMLEAAAAARTAAALRITKKPTWTPDSAKAMWTKEDGDEPREKMQREAADHPDYNGWQLLLIGRMIREHLPIFKQHGYQDVGVYIEWASCYQPPREGLKEITAYNRSRTLHSLWFAHSLTTCCLNVEVSEGQKPYWERGWNAFEGRLSWLLKPTADPDSPFDVWAHVYELHGWASVTPATRPPPPAPDAFEKPHGELCELYFENGDSDRQFVSERLASVVNDAVKEMKELDYSSNEWDDESIHSLGNALNAFASAERLHLSGNSSITSLPSEIGNLSTLRTLFCHACSSLQSLPDTIGYCSKLQAIYMIGCQSLITLPDSICGLKQLAQLDLTRCARLTYLPNSIGECRKLTAVMLIGCEALECLPERLPPLCGLYASGCKSITSLPDRLTTAPPVIHLSPRREHGLMEDAFEAMALTVHTCEESQLLEMFLSGCTSLTSLPANLATLVTLKELDLSDCTSMVLLPPSVAEVARLERLSLRGCTSIETLPPLGELQHSLTDLDLSRCSKLIALPEGLDQMLSLKDLNLEGCSRIPLPIRMERTRPKVELLARTHLAARMAGLPPLSKGSSRRSSEA